MPVASLPTKDFISSDDLYLFNEGNHSHLYRFLGAHPILENDRHIGFHFAVWAPNGRQVSVIGDFNGWRPHQNLLSPIANSGIWAGYIPALQPGSLYKYHIVSHYGTEQDKSDPFAFYNEKPPATASILWRDQYQWSDQEWLQKRRLADMNRPMAIYEVHLGSWRRIPEEQHRFLSYRELAPLLANYVKKMGFSHVEFLPVMEHPFYGSWGYQTTGYFAPTSRYGSPDDFKFLIDTLHQNNIGVILDWVPSHFPIDPHGLAQFDGTFLYEHADPRHGFHPDWKSAIFNYSRHEVRSFLLSSAHFWLDVFHADGLRVDAVASMLYLDYSRAPGEWLPNEYGGKENLAAIHFLRQLNKKLYQDFPDAHIFAEESTAWPMVSKPTETGGLGFGFKWDMGWMHDTLQYMHRDPVHRNYHHQELTFRMLYAFTENFVLPLSHDEVVHGKGSLLSKMSGDDWQKFANLRLLLGYQYAQPGKKLLFMGSEFGQWNEWNHDHSLEWHLTQYAPHQGLQLWLQKLNALYLQEPELALDHHYQGFQWINCDNAAQSILIFFRRSLSGKILVIIANFTPMTYPNFQLGVPIKAKWQEIANSDDIQFGGSGQINTASLQSQRAPYHHCIFSLKLTIPPLGILFLKPLEVAHAD